MEELQPLGVLGEALMDDLDGHPLGETGRAHLFGFVHGGHTAPGDLP